MKDPEPISIAVSVVQHGTSVLIGRRPAGTVLGGLWEFPGGRLLPGETPGEAACRECREETGLEIRILGPLETVDHAYAHGRVRIWFFLAEPREPDQQPAAPFQWVARAELWRYPFPRANATVIERLLAG